MVAHAVLTGADLHEPKGVATAAANKVYVTNGAGSGSFQDYVVPGATVVTGSYEEVLVASSFSNQNPSGLDSPLTVTFGGAVGGGSDPVQIDSGGLITFNEAGYYWVRIFLGLGRSGNTSVARMFSRVLLDGNLVEQVNVNLLESNSDVRPYVISLPMQVLANQVMLVEIARGSSGNNDGGLFSITPGVTGWSAIPSASLRVGRMNYAT